jgi:hypothetical protein
MSTTKPNCGEPKIKSLIIYEHCSETLRMGSMVFYNNFQYTLVIHARINVSDKELEVSKATKTGSINRGFGTHRLFVQLENTHAPNCTKRV